MGYGLDCSDRSSHCFRGGTGLLISLTPAASVKCSAAVISLSNECILSSLLCFCKRICYLFILSLSISFVCFPREQGDICMKQFAIC